MYGCVGHIIWYYGFCGPTQDVTGNSNTKSSVRTAQIDQDSGLALCFDSAQDSIVEWTNHTGKAFYELAFFVEQILVKVPLYC